MVYLGKTKGLSNLSTISCSQELDTLLNELYHLQSIPSDFQKKECYIIDHRSSETVISFS